MPKRNFPKPIDNSPHLCYNIYRKREREDYSMKKLRMVCFDMDGTIADLYGVNGWLNDLENEVARPYEVAEPMWDMVELAEVLNGLKAIGVEIRVITWLAKDSTDYYKEIVRKAKIEWLKKNGFPYDKFHGIAYGRTKADSIREYLAEDEMAILIDDNDKVRNGWHMGEAINPTIQDILEELRAYL